MLPGVGLYSKGMHDYVLMEAELGSRVAHAQDSEDIGFGPVFDLQYLEWCRSQPDWTE